MRALSAVNKYFLKYKYHLLLGVVFVVIANIFGTLPAQIVRFAIDLVTDISHIHRQFQGTNLQSSVYERYITYIVIFGLLIVAMAFLRGIFMFFMRQTIIVMSRLIEYDQKNEIYNHYQVLPMSFYRKNNTGDLMARISEDVSKVRMYYGPAVMYGINLVTTFVLVIALMLSINVSLTLWVLLPLPFLSILIYVVNNMIEQRSLNLQQSLSALSTYVQEAFAGIRVIKSFAREQDAETNLSQNSTHYYYKSMALAKVSAFFGPVMMVCVGTSILIVIFIGGMRVIEGSVSPGNIAEFIMYVTMLTWPFTALGWVSSIVQRAQASQSRINEFLNINTDIISAKDIKTDIAGKIVFDNVSLHYPESDTTALKNINFELNSGEALAILGTTGSGKSTIANLLCRMMDTTSGNIFIDNINIKDYNLHHFRNQVGYVPQDIFLFSDTIKNNIGFGALQISDDKIMQAAKDADFYDNIMDFADKFDTKIGERGITLSGGQKQRLSIARALARDPKILILDDCLSAVDTHTENTILNNLARIMQNRSTIIISHRVSSAKLADYILFIDNGKIVEHGTHDKLMAMQSRYKELYDKQMQTEAV
ncbi:MAG: ABC transporter ATP-binding protein [Cytophagales bacterium]|nr:ABC transporter ATP-binding protein [Cytophagales bacterium]